MVKNILITGASGFLAQSFIRTSSDSDYNIILYTRNHSLEDLEDFVEISDFIFHFAGEVKPNALKNDMFSSNLFLTDALVDILIKKGLSTPIIFPSTIHAINPKNDYGMSKKQAECSLKKYHDTTKASVFIFRLPHIFGYGCKPNYNSVLSTWIYNTINNLDVVVYDRNIEMSYLYVDDFCRAATRIVSKGQRGVFEFPVIDKGYLYHVTLGELADYLYNFKKSKNLKSVCPDDTFERKLLDVYRHYLNSEN